MAKKLVQKIDLDEAIRLAMDSDTGTSLTALEGYKVLVSEVTVKGEVEGTLLFVPGITFKQLRLSHSS